MDYENPWIVVHEKLKPELAENLIEEWFKQNPKGVCYYSFPPYDFGELDWFKVRRGHVREDVMEHTYVPQEVKNGG